VQTLRIGILGAAAIAPQAIVKPARECPEVTVAGVAARDRQRAEEFAARHGIPDGAPVLTGAADAVRTMELVDDTYRAAVLAPRQPTNII
jgi:predicted dehydrogenase